MPSMSELVLWLASHVEKETWRKHIGNLHLPDLFLVGVGVGGSLIRCEG